LALDGGGIRGVLSLEILAEIERKLAVKTGLTRLGDYFDYIGGTSTGAIIAAGLSIGMTAAELLQFYREAGVSMFDRGYRNAGVANGIIIRGINVDSGTNGDVPLAAPPTVYWVQVGAFKTVSAATRVAAELRRAGLAAWNGAPATLPGKSEPELVRVRVGPYTSRADAQSKLHELVTRGYTPFIAEARN
jgi:hypothetical protein